MSGHDCTCPFDVEAMIADRKRRNPFWRRMINEEWQPKPTIEELRFYAWFETEARTTKGRKWWLLGVGGDSEGEKINEALHLVASELRKCRDPRPWYERRLAEATS